MKKFLLYLFLVFSVLMYVGCNKDDGGTEPENDVNSDIPADPGTAPPPVKDGPLKPSVAVDVDVANPSRIKLNVAGLLTPGTTTPITYSTDNLTVVEDGVVQGIKVTKIGETVSLGTDIVFIIDITGSMGGTIEGVKESILAFLDNLRTRGLNVSAGAVAYSDNNDNRIPFDINGIADDTDPGAFTVVGSHDLSTNLDSTASLYQFIDGLSSCYEGYCGGDSPEGGFDALYWAFENYTWRSGAQKMFIVMTDIATWGDGASEGSGTSHSPWRTDELAAELAGNATVHVVSPDEDYMSNYNDGSTIGAYDMRWLAEPGTFTQNGVEYTSAGTGGIWIDIYGTDRDGNVDLTTVPITSVAAASALVEFVTEKADGTEKTIRVVVDITSSDGEVTIKAEY
ncbi:MAG: VWA domain-containing protein [Melioribacteraceae bacterium]|nr:VWA domain-containing protein [Melioribacteraceae bacterium]MCF8354486.1 VWA domain-containing protein [Melioribacteraceae bacterium]MCF8394096.1 VWA domain-containing protein [Melioribacteraceae bacterium]MCF8419852.1 VWA domain-containing protein [Melioribacteraceae bacterium]